MDGEDKEPTVTWSDEVKKAAAEDPKKAEFLREIGAIFRQVLLGVQTGQYASFEEGMETLTGKKPERIDLD